MKIRGGKVVKKRILSLLLAVTMVLGLAACGKNNDAEEKDANISDNADENKEVPETSTIKWARGLSGNILVTIAQREGYFEEVGLTIEEIPLDPGGLQGVLQGQVDIASNFGTYTPLQLIAAGDDMAIIGGFMMEGCCPIIALEGTKWNGVTDFVGATVATRNDYVFGSALVEAGYDPENDVIWQSYDNNTDKIAAVLSGEVQYAVLGTGTMYTAENTEGIEILAYSDDITPYYSCCRMVARNSWVEENPTTVKLLDEALLRAQCYFEANREECIEIMAEELDTDYEYVEAYMGKTEHYEINVATLKDTVLKNWEYMQLMGTIDSSLDISVIEDATYNDIYKAALDACVEKYYDDDPDFWDAQLALYEEVQ